MSGSKLAGTRTDKPVVHIIFPYKAGRTDGVRAPRSDSGVAPMRPLPIFVLGALARRHGWHVETSDESLEPLPEGRPDLVMITGWTTLIASAYLLADSYREQGIPVVMGGVHPSLLPGEALRHADSVVTGEAESVMGEVLADAAAGRLKPLYEGGLADMRDVPSVTEYADLYMKGRLRWVPTHGIQTSRGCRYNCSFCSVIRINGRGMRHMEPDRVVEELRAISRLKPRLPGPTPVYLHDDDLMSDPEYTRSLFEAIVRSKLKLGIVCQTSIGMARDTELLDLAHRAGMFSMFVGLESISRDGLVQVNKKNRPHEYKDLIKRLHERGIGITAGIIFGMDSDGPDIFDRTVEFLDEIEVDNAHMSLLTPLPGTQTFADLYEQGRIVDLDWAKFDLRHAVFEPERMTSEQLRAGLWHAYRTFHAGPARRRRFWRQLRTESARLAVGFALGSRRYTRHLDEHLSDATLSYRPHPDDIRALLATSKAPASEAVALAGRQLRDGGLTAQPVALRKPAM